LVNLDRRARPRDKEGERETERGRKADKRLKKLNKNPLVGSRMGQQYRI
jgi:hypothetical protein